MVGQALQLLLTRQEQKKDKHLDAEYEHKFTADRETFPVPEAEFEQRFKRVQSMNFTAPKSSQLAADKQELDPTSKAGKIRFLYF